ncbi:MAG: hypothetical protein ABIR79_17745 [Candidatus Binatia bacterium]
MSSRRADRGGIGVSQLARRLRDELEPGNGARREVRELLRQLPEGIDRDLDSASRARVDGVAECRSAERAHHLTSVQVLGM